jgi:predicted O-methyltransferase YrrM
MSGAGAQKAINLARGLAANRLSYPARRAEPATERTPVEALVELGFARDELETYDRDYDRAAAEVFPQLLERARAVGAEAPVAKLERPDLPAHEAKRLLYLAVRAARPDVIVETGTYNGTFSTFMLLGLRDNGRGRLVSLDLPARTPIAHAIAEPLPLGSEPGWIVPDDLRGNFELVLGDARTTLPATCERLGGIDMFLHDSLHTRRHMLFEYRQAWPQLSPGGLLLSDDAFMTPAFWWFTRRHRVPLLHVGAVGVTRRL